MSIIVLRQNKDNSDCLKEKRIPNFQQMEFNKYIKINQTIRFYNINHICNRRWLNNDIHHLLFNWTAIASKPRLCCLAYSKLPRRGHHLNEISLSQSSRSFESEDEIYGSEQSLCFICDFMARLLHLVPGLLWTNCGITHSLFLCHHSPDDNSVNSLFYYKAKIKKVLE